MSKQKRYLLRISAVTLATLLLATSCESASPDGSGKDNSDSQATSRTVTSRAPSYLEETHDFGGETIYYENMFIGDANDYPGYFKEGGDLEGYLETVESKYNCKIKFIPELSQEDIIGRVLAGQSKNLVLYKQSFDFFPLAQGGYLTKLNGVLEDDYWENLPGFMRGVTQAHAYKGDIYGFGAGYDSYHVMAAVAYNKSMIKRNNLEDPMDLYKAGNWTWDKFTELCKAATKDTNNDGKIDQWGLPQHHAYTEAYFFLSNDARLVTQDSSGKYITGFKNNPKATNALNQWYKWVVQDKIIAPNAIENEVATFVYDQTTLFLVSAIYQYVNLPSRMTDECGIVPLPTGPDVADKANNIMPAVVSMSFMLPRGVSNARGLVAVTDSLYRTEDYAVRFHNYASSMAADKDSYNALTKGFEQMKPEYVASYQPFIHPYFHSIYESMVKNGRSATAAYEEVDPLIQANLDAVLNVN